MYKFYLASCQILFLIVTFPAYLVYLVLLILPFKRARRAFVAFETSSWAKFFLFAAGGRLTVVDRRSNKNIQGGICYITNHQSMMDIIVILASLPGPIGFIAKKELLSVPLINIWMMAMGCIFLDRKSLRKSVASIKKGSQSIKNGNSMVIFPEGTRSQGGAPQEFKKGSFHLATDSDSNLIPLTIDGSYRMLEKPSKDRSVTLTIHDVIPIAGMSREQKKELPALIEKIIMDELKA
jgi:1-acyl-sn-glycerol-3-phosphate acyltransferase